MSSSGGGGADGDGSSINLKCVPVRVDIVNVEGISRTKDDYLEKHINKIFKASTFEELMHKSAEVRHSLEKLGCFREIGILIDTNKSPDATPNGYKVTFNVTEFRRFIGSVNTMVGANEGSLTFGLKTPNVFGRGEKFTIDHTMGSIYSKTSTLAFLKPFPGPWNTEASVSLFNQKLPNSFSSYIMNATGGLFDLSFESAKMIRHNMQYESTWRQLEPHSRSTSFPVREQSGHSFKSALRHILTVDYRDEVAFPSKGLLFKLVQEFAGLGGDVAYVKHDSEIQMNIPLPFDLVLQGTMRVGALKSLDPNVRAYNIHDMFFLGGPSGPTTLRGFNMRSIGSKYQNDVLGGQAYWSSAVHLFSPLPFALGRGGWGELFRVHAFANAGNITPNTFNIDDFSESCQKLLTNFRAAYGIGIAFKLGAAARIELNYCFPFKFLKGDGICHGMQFGIGVDFM